MRLFYGELGTWDSSITKVMILNKITPTGQIYWFYGLNNLTEIINIENLDTSLLTNMGRMFARCENLTIDVSSFNTSNVVAMNDMFSYDSFDDFAGIKDVLGLDKFDMSKVTDVSLMFKGTWGLSDNCLNGIMSMCINANKITDNKTLRHLGVSQDDAVRCETLTKYQDFVNAGWTTGY